MAAHLVHVDQRTAGIGGARREHALAALDLATVIRRPVDVDVEFGATSRLRSERAHGAPDVFADADANLHATDDVQLELVALVARSEIARLVEHAVVGQQPFAIGAFDLAASAHGSSVVQIAIALYETNDGNAVTGSRRNGSQHVFVVADESRLQHEIFGRVTRDAQLGERNDVALRGLGPIVVIEDLGEVALQIADGWIYLRERNAKPSHSGRLPKQAAGLWRGYVVGADNSSVPHVSPGNIAAAAS